MDIIKVTNDSKIVKEHGGELIKIGDKSNIHDHPVAFAFYVPDVSEEAKEVMNGIMRDVLRELGKKGE